MDLVKANKLLDEIEWSIPLESSMKRTFEACRELRRELNDEGTRAGKPGLILHG